MRCFIEPLQEWKDFETINQQLPKLKGTIQITGCMDAGKPHLIYGMGQRSYSRFVVTFDEQKAKDLLEARRRVAETDDRNAENRRTRSIVQAKKYKCSVKLIQKGRLLL